MTFQYKVRDPLGKVHEGSLEAAGREDAAQMLHRDGFQVLSLEEGDGGLHFLARRIKKSEIIDVTSQLAVMVDTGITLSAALEGICRQEENPTFKKLLASLKNDVESGEDFSAALAKHPKHFDKTYVSLVKAAEHTGALGEMLERIAEHLDKELEARRKVVAALAYPTVMAVVALCVTIFLLTYVLPKFAPLFDRKGVSLPSSTVFMMSLSHLLIEYWYLWLAGTLAVIVAFFLGRRTEGGRTLLDWVKIHVPILGPMLRKVIISRSINALGTMLQGGVSMLDALRLAAEVAGNRHYERVWLKVLDEVMGGRQICETLAGNPLFPPTLVQMIGSGEESAKLPFVLRKISSYYDREVETSLKTVTSLIEPLMIVVMGVVVGWIAMSLLLPIFSLSRPH